MTTQVLEFIRVFWKFLSSFLSSSFFLPLFVVSFFASFFVSFFVSLFLSFFPPFVLSFFLFWCSLASPSRSKRVSHLWKSYISMTGSQHIFELWYLRAYSAQMFLAIKEHLVSQKVFIKPKLYIILTFRQQFLTPCKTPTLNNKTKPERV